MYLFPCPVILCMIFYPLSLCIFQLHLLSYLAESRNSVTTGYLYLFHFFLLFCLPPLICLSTSFFCIYLPSLLGRCFFCHFILLILFIHFTLPCLAFSFFYHPPVWLVFLMFEVQRYKLQRFCRIKIADMFCRVDK